MDSCRRLGPLVIVLSLAACKHHTPGADDAVDAPPVVDACEGLSCSIVDCNAKGLPPTSVSGTVYAPNGTLPLFGVTVYVPASDPGPLADGAVCDRCATGLPGGALTQTVTDEAGHFTLPNVPATSNVPIVVQVGKWRRQLKIANIAACQDLPLAATDTRLPKNTSEGDLPKIAISTGSADALECLVRKLGIDDKEITGSTQPGKIHLFTDAGAGGGQGTNQFMPGFPGGTGMFTDSSALWSSVDKLKQYDIVIFSCEGDQHPETKSQAALDAVKAYADFGGRVFLSHWHNVWIEGSTQGGGTQKPAVWPGIATWNNSSTTFAENDTIDETANPKGMSFATWMMNVMGSTVRDAIPVQQGKQTATGVDPTKAERWVYWTSGATQYPQNFQFTTPNEQPADQRCGKVVFSDMHVSSGSSSAAGAPGYPSKCSAAPLTPQEKALAFMFFDIASCVGSIF